MVKQRILEDLKTAVKELGYPVTDPDSIGTNIVCNIPKNPKFGDYTTNLALQLAKQDSQNHRHSPLEIANEILQKFGTHTYLEKVEVAGGFINFFVKKSVLANDLKEILQLGENFGKSEIGSGKKARVEFVSANPTGPLHMGNARSAPLGDVLASVLHSQGYQVLREFIDNNVGEQVKALGATIKAKISGNSLDANQYQGEYISDLAKNLEVNVEKLTDEEVGRLAVEFLHEEILADCHLMGIKFDLVVHESDLRKEAAKVLEQLRKKGVLKEKDGALWLAPNDEFLKDRETVVQKTDGNYTYFTADIVYHKQKFESGAEVIIDVFGSNHHGHVPRLQAAALALGFDPKRLKVVLYQYVRVKRGKEVVKMSKRAGNFITAKEVLEEVGKDAFRFYLLRFAPQTHMDFDLELVKEQTNKNPVYYVQYAHARMVNILLKAKDNKEEANLELLTAEYEQALIKHLLYLPDLLAELALSFQVHHLTDYAISLADYFHKFYEACPVLSAESKELVKARLALVKASKITLANTLEILGVLAPERM
ncbi:arginine--tRNA ligase [Candidatus Daviesbacteria bacterium]|nr:arginine--tRNA ligase [Candidatus Daviesbacteria bacterium]